MSDVWWPNVFNWRSLWLPIFSTWLWSKIQLISLICCLFFLNFKCRINMCWEALISQANLKFWIILKSNHSWSLVSLGLCLGWLFISIQGMMSAIQFLLLQKPQWWELSFHIMKVLWDTLLWLTFCSLKLRSLSFYRRWWSEHLGDLLNFTRFHQLEGG